MPLIWDSDSSVPFCFQFLDCFVLQLTLFYNHAKYLHVFKFKTETKYIWRHLTSNSVPSSCFLTHSLINNFFLRFKQIYIQITLFDKEQYTINMIF